MYRQWGKDSRATQGVFLICLVASKVTMLSFSLPVLGPLPILPTVLIVLIVIVMCLTRMWQRRTKAIGGAKRAADTTTLRAQTQKTTSSPMAFRVQNVEPALPGSEQRRRQQTRTLPTFPRSSTGNLLNDDRSRLRRLQLRRRASEQKLLNSSD